MIDDVEVIHGMHFKREDLGPLPDYAHDFFHLSTWIKDQQIVYADTHIGLCLGWLSNIQSAEPQDPIRLIGYKKMTEAEKIGYRHMLLSQSDDKERRRALFEKLKDEFEPVTSAEMCHGM